MNLLWLDRETWNEQDLKVVGTYQYAASAEDLIISYALNDGPVQDWDVTADPLCPEDLYHALQTFDEVWAHNAQFDRAVHQGRHQRHLPQVEIERWRCSMSLALSHALPASLSALCEVLNVPEDMSKLKEGKKLVKMFTQPTPANQKIRRHTRHTKPDEWARFVAYAVNDVSAMRECVRRTPKINWDEACVEEYLVDQRCNQRGFAVDRDLVEAAVVSSIKEAKRLRERFMQLTDGACGPTQREQFRLLLNKRYGLDLDDTTSDTFTQLIKRHKDTLDPDAVELMQLSMSANKTSTAKYAALSPCIMDDERFRGALQFAGAGRTRRWAGRVFQAHNLPSRGLPKAELVQEFIDAIKNDTHDLLFTDTMKLASAALRGVVVAPPGKKLIVADLANIEGRKLAWFAGENWKLEAFRAYDAGTGPDLYNVTAVSIIGGDPWKVDKTDRNVFGKVPDLACLGADTLVLTSAGCKRIVDVTTLDLLWDGKAWVAHRGLANRGVRQVTQLDGVTLTPDHLINVSGRWLEATSVLSKGEYLFGALKTGDCAWLALAPSAFVPSVSHSAVTAPRAVSVYDLVDAGSNSRFCVRSASGWLLVHNSGYQGGVAGYQKFAHSYGVRMADHLITMQKNMPAGMVEKARANFKRYGFEQAEDLEISIDEWIASEACKIAWRSRHPATEKLWYNLQDAFKQAIRQPGEIFRVGNKLRMRVVKYKGNRWLLIALPSGRYLTYFEPHIMNEGSLAYMGEAAEEGKTTRMWQRVFTHGGKITGNVCQTSARDTLAGALTEAEKQDYLPVLSVHDEAICEVPDNERYTAEGLISIMTKDRAWMEGLPLAAAGFETYRYRKE